MELLQREAPTQILGLNSIELLDFGGPILGEIRAEERGIGVIIAPSMGTAQANATVLTGDQIDEIDVSGDVFADIDATAFFGNGGVARFEAASFHGTMTMQEVGLIQTGPELFEGAIRTTGAMAGTIVINGDFVNMDDPGNPGGGIPPRVEVRSIEAGAGGLTGQVIINADNAGATWADGAEVTVGSSYSLQVPEYTVTAASLGGGAVGLAPFRLHDESCYPANNSVIPDSGSLQFIWVQHYGPVEFQQGVFPLRISRRLAASQDPFVEISSPGNLFNVGIDGSDDKRVRITEKVTSAFEDGYTYKIEPLSSLKSSLVAGTPEVADYDYFITISSSACPFEPCLCSTDPNCGLGLMASGPDFDQDRWVADSDLDLMMKAIGVPGGRADLNMDQMVDSEDIAILIKHWGKYEPK